MTTALEPAVIERVLLHGDLKQLNAAQKLSYYNAVCASLGLNPLTKPFAYIVLNGKEVLYATRDAAEQLRKLHNISIDPKGFTREVIEGVYVVTASALLPNGRTDVSTGAVGIDGLKGEARANAMMKAETKAKRRVTLSICGLGMLDETEVETIPQSAQEPMRVRIKDVQQETKKGRKSGESYTKTTVVLDNGVEVVTLNNDLAATAKDCFEAGCEVQITTRESRWGVDIATISKIPTAAELEDLAL
jgi:hypothetical protein